MNPNAQKWITALRSGEFRQTTGALHLIEPDGGERFCCLGVACVLYEHEVGGLTIERSDSNRGLIDPDCEVMAYDDAVSVLPHPVKDWLGLKRSNGQWDPPDDRDSGGYALSACNDRGASFADIADIIESEPPGLFKAA